MSSIAEIKTMPDGAPVVEVSGTVKAVRKYRDGIGRNNGSVQRLVVKDQTGDITIAVWDRVELSPKIGEAIILRSTRGSRGFGGVSVCHDTHDGKTEVQLKIGKSADLLLGAEVSGTTPAPAPAPAAPAPRQAPAPAPEPREFWASDGTADPVRITEAEARAHVAGGWKGMLVDVRDPSGTWRLPAFYGFHAASVPDPEPDPAPDPEPDPAPQPTAPSGEPDGRHERAERSNCVLAKKHVARHGNAMKLCIDRALKIGDWYEQRTGRPMPESWLQGMATSFYIAMKPDFDYKTGQPRVGMIDSLPDMKDISEVFPGLDTPPASAGQ